MKYDDIEEFIEESVTYSVISMADWNPEHGFDDLILDISTDDLDKQTSLFNPQHLGDLGDTPIDIINNGKIIFTGTKAEVDNYVDSIYKTFNGTLQFSVKGAVIHTIELAN